jgi:hypothetical protein
MMGVRTVDYKYYNQHNYTNTPYPSPDLPKATVKSGGCGVCCASMIVENLTAHQIGPKLMATYAINKRARISGGTDMNTLAKAICADYGLEFRTTNDEAELLNHLRAGGMAIANVGGNRGGYVGVFSDGGHFIVVAGLTDAGNCIVLDPGYYPGKFSGAGRIGRVKISGNQCICNLSVLGKDTENRSPAYWLFERKVEEVPEWMKKIMSDAKAAGLITIDHNPNDPATKWFVLAIALKVIEIVKGGK